MAVKSRPKGSSRKKKKSGNFRRILYAFLIVLGVSMLVSFYFLYSRVLQANLVLKPSDDTYLYIKNSDKFEDVVRQLSERNLLRNQASFVWLSEFLDYHTHVKPGRYAVKNGMSNKDLILLLRSGKQEPLRITYKSIRTQAEFAGKSGALLEADSLEILQVFRSADFQSTYGLNAENALSVVLPDTYEFYWNTTADDFVKKLGKYYLDFWNAERKQKAENIGLTPAEVAVLASIVQQESNRTDEWPVIAGVYLNRLQKGMKLQADPTVKFAVGDPSIRRVRGSHLKTNSPYNTYMYNGLPPGPIYLASKSCMDAVLDYQRHQYIYFCARPDQSGLHDFAKTFEEHLRNARKYQQRLNERGI